MRKRRVVPPRKIADEVRTEFNHRCAICGDTRPQLHHIDGDPSNNDTLNLLPLCPSCHLTDQHNPTATLDPGKLSLFRKYKDPSILSPKFDPLFRRLVYLLSVDEHSDVGSAHENAIELVAFLDMLAMGRFYHARVSDLITPEPQWFIGRAGDNEGAQRGLHESRERYRAKLLANRDRAVALIVEMLRYQDWPPPIRWRNRDDQGNF